MLSSTSAECTCKTVSAKHAENCPRYHLADEQTISQNSLPNDLSENHSESGSNNNNNNDNGRSSSSSNNLSPLITQGISSDDLSDSDGLKRGDSSTSDEKGNDFSPSSNEHSTGKFEADIQFSGLSPIPASRIESTVQFTNYVPDMMYIVFQNMGNFNDPKTNLGYQSDNYVSGFLPDYILKYGSALGWNTIDGVCAIFAAIDLYQKGCNEQSALSFLNGSQLILTSWAPELISAMGYTIMCSSMMLTPVSFAISTLVDLIQIYSEFSDAEEDKELNTWFDKRIRSVEQIEEKLNSDISTEEKQKLTMQKSDFLLEIGCRYRVNKGLIENTELDTRLQRLNTGENSRILNLNANVTNEDQTVNRIIQEKANKRYEQVQIDLGFKFLSLSGMSLGAVKSCALLLGLTIAANPLVGITIAAAVICTVVAVYYLMKFISKAKSYKANNKAEQDFKKAKNNRYGLFVASASKQKADTPTSSCDNVLYNNGFHPAKTRYCSLG